MPQPYRPVLTLAGPRHPRVQEFLAVKRHPPSRGLPDAVPLEGTWMMLSGLDGGQAVRALTVLGRAWDLHEEAGPVIEAALRADLAGLAAAPGQVTIATQPRELAEALPGRYRPDLAASLSNLGVQFSALGRLADALAVTEEAVAIRRELAAALPDRYRPDLALSLSNLGVQLRTRGRPAEALPVTEEAIAILRELVGELPDRYRPALARSLSNLTKVLSALGRDDEAAAAATERDSIRSVEGPGARPLIEVEPDRFEDMVAIALDGLPEDLGRLMENVAVTVEHDKGRPGLLGLYQGIPLTKRTRRYNAVLPDKITIYRQAICATCRTEQEVIEKVRRTVIHEVGHHFGISDDRLRELGW